MEFRLWPMGFMEFIAKQKSSDSKENKTLLPDDSCFAKKLHETQSKFHELNINI